MTTATIGERTRQVDRIVPHPERGVVLAHLDTPLTGDTPAPAATTPPEQGGAAEVSGWGRTGDTWIPDQPHTAAFTVEALNTTTLSLQSTTDGTSLCKGDAGAPVLANGQLTAIVVSSHQAGCLGETSEQAGATAVRIDNITDWLLAHISDLQATPASKHAINLTWDAEAPSTRYRIYGAQSEEVAIEPANFLGETAQKHFTHGALPAGQTWHYRLVIFDGAGNEILTSTTVSATSPIATRTDFNGDGKDDIASTPYVGGDTTVALSDGQQQFGAATRWAGDLVSNGDAVAHPGDVNGDGNDDLVLNEPGGAVSVALSDGTQFGGKQRWHDNMEFNFRLGDFNGDGKSDLIRFTRGDQADAYVALSTGSSFGAVQQWSNYVAAGVNIPVVGDYNGDGKDDVASLTPGGRVYTALSDGTQFTGIQLWTTTFAGLADTGGPSVGDYNGDGKADGVLFTRKEPANVWVTLSTGNTFSNTAQWHDNFAAGTAQPLPIWYR